jgi:hypothetical protein
MVTANAALDQSNQSRASACRYTGWVPDDASSWAAQTFTAGISGALTDVVLPLRLNTPLIVVAIASVGGDGRPIVSSPLASTTVAPPVTTTYTDVTVSFAAPVRVEAGKQYAIVLSQPALTVPDVAWRADVGSAIRDPSGTPCADGAYGAGRSVVNNDGLGGDADFFFQTFVVPARHLTVVKQGTGTGSVQDSAHGLDCGSICSAAPLHGEMVTLTATASPGSNFAGWTGVDCTAPVPTCSFLVSADTTVTATFTLKTFTVVVSRRGSGAIRSAPAGIVCGKRCRYAFVPGAITLTATPSSGWRFARWQGGCRGTKLRCRFILSRATTVTASFVRAPTS